MKPVVILVTRHCFKGNKSILWILLSVSMICIFTPDNVYAAWEIYTYSSGDFTAAIFRGVSMLMGGDTITGLIKIALLLGLLYLVAGPVASSLSGRASAGYTHGAEAFVAMIGIGIMALIVTTGMILPKADIAIIDRVDPSQTQIVGDVPVPQAFIAHTVSTIGDVIGKEFETVFSLPDTLKFRNGGVALGVKYTDSLMDIYPPSSSTKDLPSYAHLVTQSLREYYVKCVFPNFASLDGTAGAKTQALDAIFTTPDMMTLLKDPLFRDPNTIILAPNDTGEATCSEAIDLIDDLWNDPAIYPYWLKDIETKLSAGAGVSGIVGSTSINLGTGILTEDVIQRYFPNSTVDSKTVLKNIAAINLMRDSVQSYLMWNGVPSATAYSITKRTTTSGWLTAAKFFNAVVHTIRAILEGIIYGMSVFVPVFMAATLSFRPLFTFSKIALWLELWVPFYVILNLYADYGIQHSLKGLFLTEAAEGPTFRTIDAIASQTEQTLGITGVLATLVPSLSFGIVYGGAYALSRFVTTIGSSVTGTAQSVGGEIMGKGNVSMGNRSFMNENFGGSSVISSQAAFKQQLLEGLSTSHMYNSLMRDLGGAGGYISAKGDTGTIKTLEDISSAKGHLEGAGGSIETLKQVRFSQGMGVIKADIESAKARASVTGEGWQDAIAGNIVAGKLFESAKNLGAENYLKEIGFSDATKAMTYGELQKGYDALATFQMGRLAGYNMDNPEGRKDFYTAMTTAKGVDVPVTAGNVEAINKWAEDKGLQTRLKEGDIAHISGDGTNITSIEARQGVNVERRDFTGGISGIGLTHKNIMGLSGVLSADAPEYSPFNIENFAGTLEKAGAHQVAKSLREDIKAGREVSVDAVIDPNTGSLAAFGIRRGGSKETEDYVRTQRGWENVSKAITKVESGSLKHIWDNYTNRVGGSHSITYDNFRETMSGLRQMGYNVRVVEDASINSGYRMMFQDPKTQAVVAGDIKNVVTAYRQTIDGATREVLTPGTGNVLVSKSEYGELREQFMNRLNINMGVKVDGTATEGVRKAFGEGAAVGAGAVVDGVGTIGGAIGGIRKIGSLAPKKAKPTGTGATGKTEPPKIIVPSTTQGHIRSRTVFK